MSLKAKLADKGLFLIKPIEGAQPKTKGIASLVRTFPVRGKTLLVIGKMTDSLKRSTRNIPNLLVKSQKDVSAYDLLRHRSLVIEEAAFEALVKGKQG